MSNIWTEPSRYGVCTNNTKPISKSTAYRWQKDNRSSNRKSRSYRKALALAK